MIFRVANTHKTVANTIRPERVRIISLMWLLYYYYYY